MTTRVAITGIGLVSALGSTREAVVGARMLAGAVRHRVRSRCSTPTGFRSRIAAGSRPFELHARADAARAAALVAQRSDRRPRRAEALARCGPARQRASIVTASASCSARARAICCATRTTTSRCSPRRHRSRAAVECLESFLEHAGRRHRRSASVSRACAPAWSRPVRRARSRSVSAADAIAAAALDAALARRDRRARAADVQRVQSRFA